ncbi:MAG: radical SAM protein [Candidatus Thorarchaeota archaeon]
MGVPPYVSMYPRYIAGAIWTHSPRTEVLYQTIDQVRTSFDAAWNLWSTADLLLLIAGMIVPGKYLGGTPISVREARELFSHECISHIPKLLVGPWARFGCGLEGGKISLSSEVLSPPFDYIVSGDAEIFMRDVILSGDLESVPTSIIRENMTEIEEYAVRGARIITQHPGYRRKHLICEIETYRGCPRFITGGCSFCVEPSYGMPQMRDSNDIAREVEALYTIGVRAFRLGRQADMFTYGSTEIGLEEFPSPNPEAIEDLFSRVRHVAPHPLTLHIDNVNPGTVAHHPAESRQVARIIMKYHTVGDVAAFGVESLDPEVKRRNNLKVDAEEALKAVRIINDVGAEAPPWELPHLLPGINLLYGLPGESRRTLEYNMEFLKTLLEEGLMVRRINIRQVIGFEGTRLGRTRYARIRHQDFYRHKQEIRSKIDIAMIQRVAPLGTVIHSAFVERVEGNSLLLRPLGSYPLLCHMPQGRDMPDVTDVFVVSHGPRSVSVLPFPFSVHNATLAQWKSIPGIGAKRAARLKGAVSWKSIAEIESALGIEIPSWLARTLRFQKQTK